jgi:hypothetical protein
MLWPRLQKFKTPRTPDLFETRLFEHVPPLQRWRTPTFFPSAGFTSCVDRSLQTHPLIGCLSRWKTTRRLEFLFALKYSAFPPPARHFAGKTSLSKVPVIPLIIVIVIVIIASNQS